MIGYGLGFDTGFSVMGVIGVIFFIAVAGFIIFAIVKSVSSEHKNNNSPKLSVQAVIVSKRHETYHGENSSSQFYYATFQVASGDRMELKVTGQQYGLMAEGDRGILNFQGTRLLSFERWVE